MSPVRRFLLRLLLLTLLAAEIPARNAGQLSYYFESSEVDETEAHRIVPYFHQEQARSPQILIPTTNTYSAVLTTVSSVTTETILAKRTCAVLVSSITVADNVMTTFSDAPTVCNNRRRRQSWNQPVFIAVDDGNSNLQYYQLSPSQVMSFEPTLLATFRDMGNPNDVEQMVKPPVIEPSFDQHEKRHASRQFFVSPFSRLSIMISAIMSSLMTSTVSLTSYSTVYMSTETSTSYTATLKFYIAGECYPSGITSC